MKPLKVYCEYCGSISCVCANRDSLLSIKSNGVYEFCGECNLDTRHFTKKHN